VKRWLLVGLLLTIAVAAEARAGYRDLLTEMDAYLPPQQVVSQLKATAPDTALHALVPGESEFQAQRAELQGQEERWRAALSDPRARPRFLLPDPALMAAAQETARDDEAAGKLLAHGLTLEMLEVMVLVRSPAVRARESEFEGVLAGYSQAEHLDTILRRYATFTRGVMTGVGGMTDPDPVAQKFPFPGVLALKGEIINQEAAVAWEELEAARRDAITAARKAWAELSYLHEAREVVASQLRLLATQQQTSLARYQAGDAEFETVVKAGLEHERLKEELTSLVEEQGNVEMAIRSLLALPARIGIGEPAPATYGRRSGGPEALYSLALERRQEVRAAQAMVGKGERMIELAESTLFPGFTSNRSLLEPVTVPPVGQVSGVAAALPVISEPGTGAALPENPGFGADEAYLRQARQKLAALNSTAAAERATTLREVREAWYRLDKAWRQEALYRERIAALSQAGLDTATQAYESGRGGFAQFVESANSWLAARLGLARAKADILAAEAELDAAVGTRDER